MASAALILTYLASAAGAMDVATLSFSVGVPASYPGTIDAAQTISIDLSALAKETAVFRAVLRPGQDEIEAFHRRQLPVKVRLVGSDATLQLMPPRFTAFDVTAALRHAVKSSSSKVVLAIDSLSGYQPGTTRLDVTCAAKVRNRVGRVHSIQAGSRARQPFL